MSSTKLQLPTDLLPGEDTTSILTAHAENLNRDFLNHRSYVENMSFHDDGRTAEAIILKEMQEQLDKVYYLMRLSNACVDFSARLHAYSVQYRL